VDKTATKMYIVNKVLFL